MISESGQAVKRQGGTCLAVKARRITIGRRNGGRTLDLAGRDEQLHSLSMVLRELTALSVLHSQAMK